MAGFRDAIARIFSPPPGAVTQRSITPNDLWGDDWTPHGSTSGVTVTAETAMRSIAVQAAVRLLVNDIGSLPVDAFRADALGRVEIDRPSWVIEPNPNNLNETWEDHVKQVVHSILTDGNAFAYVFPSVFQPRGLAVLDPRDVDIKSSSAPLAEVSYHVRGVGALTSAEILHIPWMVPAGKKRGLNPIEAAKQGLGTALAADEFVGSYFGNGAILSGVLEFPVGSDPTPEQVATMKADFSRKHVGARKSHAVGALTGGGKYVPFDYNNRDAQLLELRDQIVEEVARLFGIPPHMLGSQKPGAVGYASVEQRSIDYVTHAVLPIVKRIEVAYSRLLPGGSTYLRFNLEGLKRGDQAARATFYQSLTNIKALRRDEVRALEDLPYDPDAVGYLETPNNNPPAEPAEPAERAAPPPPAPASPSDTVLTWADQLVTDAADARERSLREQGWLDSEEVAALSARFVGRDDFEPLVGILTQLRDRPAPAPGSAEWRKDFEPLVDIITELRDRPTTDSELAARVAELTAIVKRPSRRVVERDERGFIVAVTEVPAGGD